MYRKESIPTESILHHDVLLQYPSVQGPTTHDALSLLLSNKPFNPPTAKDERSLCKIYKETPITNYCIHWMKLLLL